MTNDQTPAWTADRTELEVQFLSRYYDVLRPEERLDVAEQLTPPGQPPADCLRDLQNRRRQVSASILDL